MATDLATAAKPIASLPALVDRAASVLANARTAAEVLEARDYAAAVYDAAKTAARLGKAKRAHDDLISAAYRVQADALEIEAQAKRRLADEYDAAQERGEVSKQGSHISDGKMRAGDILSPKEMHEARIIRDAEKADPGIVRRTVDEAIAAGEEPSKAKVRRAVLRTARPDTFTAPKITRGKDGVRQRVSDAIAALSGLPPAVEVVGYFAGTDASILIDERLPAAAAWLEEFASAWKDNRDA